MKITPRDLATLASLVAPLDTADTRAYYRAGDFPRAALVKNLDKRYRWDLFHAATRGNRDLVESLYAYLNDSHIDTALRSFLAPLVTADIAEAGDVCSQCGPLHADASGRCERHGKLGRAV